MCVLKLKNVVLALIPKNQTFVSGFNIECNQEDREKKEERKPRKTYNKEIKKKIKISRRKDVKELVLSPEK